MSVFVSYAHEDRARALQFIDALTQSGLDVWWDGLVVAGNQFAHTTEQALDAADAVIVLWSRSSVGSHWVRDEATVGRDRGKLIPVSLDGVEPPIGFRQYLVIGLSNWRGDGESAEIMAVQQAVRIAQSGGTLNAPPPARKENGAPTLVARRTVLAGSGLGVIALGAAGWYAWQRQRGVDPNMDANAVAVLPFSNIGGDKGEDYFAEGLSAEVRAVLAGESRLRVMAQSTSDVYRHSDASAQSIAEALGVAYLLEGSVRRAGDTFRIAPTLIDGRTGYSLWAQSFDRPLNDVFAVQSEIAGFVLAAVDAHMQGSTGVALPRAVAALPGGTTHIAAYDAYLRGRADYLLFSGEASDRRALAEFDAAVAADPQFAAAHAARARSLIVIANQYADAAHTAALYDEAVKAAGVAVALAPDLADAQSTLGFALFQGRLDVRGAREPYARSYRLGAGDATVLGRYALYCALTGKSGEAKAAMTHAVLLDPLNPLVHRALATVLYAAGEYAESLPPLHRALQLNPKLSNAQAAIGRSLLMLGRVSEARVAFSRESHELVGVTGIAIAERRLGNAAAARQALEKLRADLGDSALYQQAEVAAQWGDGELAMKLLTRAKAVGDSGLIYAHTDPLLAPLRALPAFAELRRQLGFE